MASKVEVKITVYESVILGLARSPETYDFVKEKVDEAAITLRESVPVRTGAARGSIMGRVEMGPDGWIGAASWDTSHYYVGILNSRDHWADRAASTVRYV